MGEAETLEIFYMQAQVLQSMGMDALSIFFAYVICTHLVGKNLSRPIAVGLTIIYSVFFGGQLVGIFVTTGQVSATAHLYMAAFPENPYGFDSSALSTMPSNVRGKTASSGNRWASQQANTFASVIHRIRFASLPIE